MIGKSFSVTALDGVPAIRPGDDLAQVALQAMAASGLDFADADILVLAQKIVSKAEGRQVTLADVTPGARAQELAEQTGKDARLVELILAESDAVMRVRQNLIIVRHRLGLVLANAGIDQSNVGLGADYGEGAQALLLPLDPDGSAAALRAAIAMATGKQVAVLVIDSLGRAWRMGTTGTAIGAAGLPALLDLRGRPDLNGRLLESSELGLADELAAAASLAMGQADEACPMVLVRGLAIAADSLSDDAKSGRASDLVRPPAMDLFP